ncbi:MAG: glutamate formimidoyltransferase [Candidatus Bipolaricaulota bacterium]|nr:glutamate formimidoyltransferase [Candidatus Bipolaricaulota bacterium]MCX7844060.1 glutamate formimidoyltransferase [Candidatus Bipolaricaulota bacterium]MDW8151953.1 glutamate formimidoyltransferase [Candidatus Bipolaricaulota bacterium]
MWDKLVECVPNVSEGRNPEAIAAMAEAIRSVPQVRLLDVQSDPDHHRTVFTFVGAPEGVAEAVYRLFEAALPRIDLRAHRGEHPRMGAVDVVPFVPVRGVKMADCVALARAVGQEIWRRFRVPVYLYAEAATRPERQDLAEIRKGEFEGFFTKIQDPQWAPDFGEPVVHPTAGVTAVGAREFLIAFNVNLGTRDLRIAQEIAKAVRFSSGGLRYVKALGMELKERGIVQVSMNLTNFRKTPLPRVLELVRREAQRYGVPVVGTEIVGLIPEEALVQVAEYYLQLERFSLSQVLERRLEEALGA